jgi:uncharacterized cupin superfamily protein
MSKPTTSSIADLLAAMGPDPDKPANLTGEWGLAPFTEGELESGVWSATVDVWDEDDYPVHEVIVMISGHLRITEPDGTTTDLHQGDMYHFPKGWAGRWEVLEDMQKIYFVIG